LPPYPGVCAPDLPANRQQRGLTTPHVAPCHFEAIRVLSSVDIR
jgi:hypothetical protein